MGLTELWCSVLMLVPTTTTSNQTARLSQISCALLLSSFCRWRASGSSRSLRCWLEKVKALWAVASTGGVVRGEVDGGEEEVEQFEEVEVGEGKPELPSDDFG